MPEIKITFKDMDRFRAALKASPRIVAKHLQKAITTATFQFERAVKQNIRTGRDMWKPPIDTGRMWNAFQTSIYTLRGEITNPVRYSVFVHEGTYKMQARPFLTITERTEQEPINKLFQDELEAAMNEIA